MTMQDAKSMDHDVIVAQGLTKDYGQGRGVFGLSFSVRPGEVFGFLGSNGAGKTVTMRQLMGFIRPQAGSARIFGLDCFSDRATIQERLGYLPGEIALPEDISGSSFLAFMASMRHMRDRTRMHELIERFELDPRPKIRRMSKGTKQKVGLVCAFMGQPDVLLLDEPTSGFDPLMQGRFIELVRQERDRGAAILLSSHIFEEVERACDRVAFIRAGRLADTERMEDVRRSRRHAFRVTFCTAAERARYQQVCAQAGSTVRVLDERTVELWAERGVDAFVKRLAGFDVEGLSSREQTLEEMFLHFMSHPATTMTGFMLNYLYGFLFTWVALLLIMMMVNRMVMQPIDRGSLSCVLSTLASRLRIALTLALALLTSLVVTLALIIVAQLALAEAQYPGELDLPALARASAGLFCLWLFMAGLCFASACCFRDGRVALWAGGGACLLMFLAQMATQVGTGLEVLHDANPMELFDPYALAASSGDAAWHAAALAVAGLAFLVTGVAVFCRRDFDV